MLHILCQMHNVIIYVDSGFRQSSVYVSRCSHLCSCQFLSVFAPPPPPPMHTPGDLHRKFTPTLGLLHPNFCLGVGNCCCRSRGQAFLYKRLLPFLACHLTFTIIYHYHALMTTTFIQWQKTISDTYLTDTPPCFPFILPNTSLLPQGCLASIPSNAIPYQRFSPEG